MALRNVDKVIAENEGPLKDTLLNFESFTASLASSTGRIDSVVSSTQAGVDALDSGLTKTQKFLASLASDKSGGELLPTVISIRELAESFNKRSAAFMSEGRKMLGDLSQSATKAGRKLGSP